MNIKGEVVGINTAISTRSGGYDGVGFAIPINKAKWIGKQLRESGHVRRAFLGVRIQSVTPDLADKFQTRPGAGAIVTNILPNSPAENSELRTGDVILKMAGKNVNSTLNLQGIVEQLEIDKPYPLTILRDGKQINTSITVNEMPGDYLTARVDTSNTEPQIPRDADDGLGMELVELKTETARQLGVDPIPACSSLQSNPVLRQLGGSVARRRHRKGGIEGHSQPRRLRKGDHQNLEGRQRSAVRQQPGLISFCRGQA